jgi:type IV secretory pathway VirD2 relaxase
VLRRDSNNLGGRRQLLRRTRPAEERGPGFPCAGRAAGKGPAPGGTRPQGKSGWKGAYVPGPQAGGASQRVIVQTVPMKAGARGFRSMGGLTKAQLQYLERDGRTPEHQPELYTVRGNEQAIQGFAERAQGDPHQFHVVLSPENGHALDMTQYTRRFMEQVEKDTRSRLDWVAANHYDTKHPHTHILVRGRGMDGQEVGLKPHYMTRGMTYRAQDLATETLGTRQAQELVQQQARRREWEQELMRAHERLRVQERAQEKDLDHGLER